MESVQGSASAVRKAGRRGRGGAKGTQRWNSRGRAQVWAEVWVVALCAVVSKKARVCDWCCVVVDRGWRGSLYLAAIVGVHHGVDRPVVLVVDVLANARRTAVGMAVTLRRRGRHVTEC